MASDFVTVGSLVAQYTAQIETLRAEADALKGELAAAQSSTRRLREALERLSRLGNGSGPGNSEVNCIAQEALLATDDAGGAPDA